MMTNLLRRIAAALVATMAVCLPASATTFSTDYTDLWWNPSEDGWGINLIQQGEVIFATMFVYGADNTNRWYVASNLTGSSQSSFSGPLYQTNGPYFAAAWNQAQRTTTQVGTMTVNFSGDSGTLSYTVNGTTVNKSIVRMTWRNNSMQGNYLGGITANSSGCSGGQNTPILIFNTMTISGSSSVSIAINFFTNGGTSAQCNFNGSYAQAGQMGNVNGNWNCSTGNTGTFSLSQLQVGINGITGKFSGRDQFCTYNGNFGGVRDVI